MVLLSLYVLHLIVHGPTTVDGLIHAAMLYTCDGADAGKLCAMLRDVNSNMFKYFAPDFRIAQPFIIRFSNGFQQCDDDLMSFL